ncbi:DUF6691 family protein [Aliidiomarina maris]|uniref:Sulphur transport domain-containing protein n=1 Tax=Aliidiomarina maris TaxID=531312 RepID=A0A327X4Y2_9GAMM|nr:DUF6691 family protein [Aliidiomarina maris]MCL5049134.1 YeeE/YedE family protein [Bacillota bacterium]RAK01709.1 hypothetical protein B0I24_101336 [Aliidiomarina maris]RUO28530.1 hypothetical protein CWE07_01620 [Aliidiomarina maris]
MVIIIAFLSGLLMTLGMAVSAMIDPNKVLGFLHIGPNWDPSLALVMAAALAVFAPGYFLSKKRQAPVCEREFHAPTNQQIDRRLLVGAVLFGLGWGLVGYCPGPAIAALTSGSIATITFVACMGLGWFVSRKI